MIAYKSRKEVYETDGVTIFSYSLNQRAVKMFEFGAFFLLIVATLIAPLTNFEPRQWMAVALALALAATAAFCTARYWRMFATTEFIGWDEDNFYVTQGRKGVAVIPWNVLDLNNTGLKDPTSGSVLNIHLSPEEPIIKLRLVAGFIIVQKFQTVLATILTHIKQNMEKNGTLKPKETTASEETKPTAASAETKPTAASEETKPTAASAETKPTAASEETKPNEASEETKPTAASEETKPTAASEETKDTQSEEQTSK